MPDPARRITQVSLEVDAVWPSGTRISQVALEVDAVWPSGVRISQVMLEVDLTPLTVPTVAAAAPGFDNMGIIG